jgi:hypothetical protein
MGYGVENGGHLRFAADVAGLVGNIRRLAGYLLELF